MTPVRRLIRAAGRLAARFASYLLSALNPAATNEAFAAGMACFRILVALKLIYGLVLYAFEHEIGGAVGHWLGGGPGYPYFSTVLLVLTLLPLPWQYVVKRVALMFLTLWAASFVAFCVIQVAPGDFTSQLRMNQQVPQETIDDLKAKYGQDKPLLVQYGNWVWGILARQDFGVSTQYLDEPVFKVIRTRMLATFRLSIAAMIMVWLISVPIGIYAAIRQYSVGDKIFSVLAFIGMSLPTFFVAFLLAYLATEVHWLPSGGSASLGHEEMSQIGKVLDTLWHMIIPVSVLTIARIAGMMRLMRGNMLEVKRAQYVTTARAKGLNERKVIYKHMLRNAVNPMVTIFGYQLSGLLSGVALTEAVLGYPGLGRLILDAVMAQDLFLVMASMMMGTTLLLIGNLIADLLLVAVDPRIKVQ
jgi:peptide/nickel transport system permease protein